MRTFLTEQKWDGRPAYIWGLRNPQNGTCYIWADQHAAGMTATPVIECDPATGEAKAGAQPVRVCKVWAKYVKQTPATLQIKEGFRPNINAEHFLGWTFGSEDIYLEVKTVRDRIKEAVYADKDMESDNLNKLLALAYYMGREEATRETSDKYNAVLEAQRKRAEACRYYKMAAAIIGNFKAVYSPDYAGEMSLTFGDDVTEL